MFVSAISTWGLSAGNVALFQLSLCVAALLPPTLVLGTLFPLVCRTLAAQESVECAHQDLVLGQVRRTAGLAELLAVRGREAPLRRRRAARRVAPEKEVEVLAIGVQSTDQFVDETRFANPRFAFDQDDVAIAGRRPRV